MTTRAIVVGADGTDSSNAAVDWAAHEARSRRLPLRVVHAFDWDRQQDHSGIESEYTARKVAEGIVAAAGSRARHIAADIAVEPDSLVGDAVPCLLEASRDAEVLVLGSRGRGGFSGLLLGSVSQRLATLASCPVVVMRGRAGASGGPVVAGVDDSPAASLVLQDAFTAAAAQDRPLAVIRSYLPVRPLTLYDVMPETVDTPEQDAAEHARLLELLAPWSMRFPDVPVEVVVTHTGAALALVQASRRASLIVVASRGRGALAGALLGSTSLQVLHHAACPVRITRPRTPD